MQTEQVRRDQSLQLIELFIDLIHGDLVRGDAACRYVADGIISAYEIAIRWLVTHEVTFTPALKGAINTYCARNVLRNAPELLISSDESAMAYQQIAAVLSEAEGMEQVGKAIADELSHLTHRLETKRFSRLLDLMGQAVITYMQQADQQHKAEKVSNVPVLEEPAFWTRLEQFVELPTRLLGDERKKRKLKEENMAGENEISNQKPEQNFEEELRLAMYSPAKDHAASCKNNTFIACARPQSSLSSSIAATQTEESRRAVETAMGTGRTLLQANDSVLAATKEIEKRDSQTVQDVSSSIALSENLDVPLIPVPRSLRKTPLVAGGTGEVDTSLFGSDVQVRSYFLCAKTNRYEPEGARGFFV